MLRTRATAQMLDGPGRGLAHRRRDLRRAALGDHDAGRARALGGAADRARGSAGPGPGRARRSGDPRRRAAPRRPHRGRRRPPRRRPGGRSSRSGARSPRAEAEPAPRTPSSHGSRAAPAVAHTSPTLARAAPAQRLCDGVAPVEDHSGSSSKPLGPVADLPAERGDLLAQAVRGREVALRAGALALLGQLAHRIRRLRRSARAGSRGPSTPSISRRWASPGASHRGLVASRDPLVHDRERLRRVEVAGERIEEAIAQPVQLVRARRPRTAAVRPRGCG